MGKKCENNTKMNLGTRGLGCGMDWHLTWDLVTAFCVEYLGVLNDSSLIYT
jgi:hypothetical protein